MMMKKIKYIFALVIIFSCLILFFDGFGDFTLYARYKATQPNWEDEFINHLPNNMDRKYYKKIFDDSKKIKFHNVPFLDRIAEQGNYGIYKIDEYGHRIFPADLSISEMKQKKMLLLGSSQSFGYHLEVEDTLSVQMRYFLPEYKIDNYSMLGADLGVSFVDWYRMAEIEKKSYDLVVIVNSFFRFYRECNKNIDYSERLMDKYRLPALVSIINLLKNSFFKEGLDNKDTICEQAVYQNIAAREVNDRWNQLLDFGKEQGSKTIIFIPPTVWGGGVNVENLKPLFNERNRAIISTINKVIYAKTDNKAIIDLAYAFDNGKQYFLDTGSHFTPEGSALLAREIAKHIQDLDNKALGSN